MIRRWSRLTTHTIDLYNYKRLFFKYHFKSFRKAIIFRKFFILFSKINRKHYSRLKHSYNWMVYSQIWQHWVRDFYIQKSLSKFYYKKSLSWLELITYDPYKFNTKQTKLNYFTNHISCGIPKTFFIFKNKNVSADSSIFLKNLFLHYSYFSPFTVNPLFKPILINLQSSLISIKTYSNLTTINFSMDQIYWQLFAISLKTMREFYLINTLLWYLLITKKEY